MIGGDVGWDGIFADFHLKAAIKAAFFDSWAPAVVAAEFWGALSHSQGACGAHSRTFTPDLDVVATVERVAASFTPILTRFLRLSRAYWLPCCRRPRVRSGPGIRGGPRSRGGPGAPIIDRPDLKTDA